jgi:hypothetical protein
MAKLRHNINSYYTDIEINKKKMCPRSEYYRLLAKDKVTKEEADKITQFRASANQIMSCMESLNSFTPFI